jgi:hypothetical protein
MPSAGGRGGRVAKRKDARYALVVTTRRKASGESSTSYKKDARYALVVIEIREKTESDTYNRRGSANQRAGNKR